MKKYVRNVVVDYSTRKNPERERPYQEIAERLNAWRMSSGIMNKDISETSGIPDVTISRVFQGTRFPDYRLLSHLHNHYGIDLNWLICGDQG